jgi:hypothetical protein
MKNVFRLLLLAGAVCLGIWFWTVLFPAPEKVVRRKMASLAANATFSANDSNLTRAAKAGKVAGFFADDAQIILDVSGLAAQTLSGREEIREHALGGFASLSGLKVDFLDVAVRVSTDRQAADVSCTLRVNINGNKDFGVQEMRFQLKKIDGTWLITRVETVKTLS